MRARSGHIIFSKKTKYRDLAPVYTDLFMKFLQETGQEGEEDEYTNMLVRTNLLDLEENRKPEGYNRMGSMRLIFPIKKGGTEFYVYRHQKSTEVVRITESISRFLKAKDLDHKVEWDRLLLYEGKK